MGLPEIMPKTRKVFYVAALIAILLLAFTIRMQPTKYGIYLYEYDPYFMYWVTRKLVDHGPLYWFDLTADNVKNFWYPWGRDVWKTEYPGVPMLGYLAYNVGRLFAPNIPENELLMIIGVVLPPLAGVLEVLAIFLIGRELRDEKTGLVGAFMAAVMASAIDRTIAGFYTKLGFGVMFFLYSMFFFIKSIKLGFTGKGALYALISGIFLGLVGFTWGGYYYAVLVYALYAILVAILGINTKEFTITYTLTVSIATAILVLVPKISATFMTSLSGLALILSLAVLYIDLTMKNLGYSAFKRALTLTSLGIIGLASYIVLVITGHISPLPGRALSIILPWLRFERRLALFASVAEHATISWDYVFYHLSVAFIFIPIGLAYLLKERKLETLLIFTAAISAIYGVTSAAYLAHLAGPLAALAGSYGLVVLSETLIKELIKKPPRGKRIRYFAKINPAPIVGVLLVIVLVVAIVAPLGIKGANVAPTIISPQASTRGKNLAWLKALEYIRNNLPRDAVVNAWWDYGYWITVIGNRTSICDNATLNSTQIKLMAWALMRNETYAADIFLNKFKEPPNASYLLAFEVFYHGKTETGEDVLIILRGGDISKSVAIVSVGGLNATEYFGGGVGEPNWFSDKTRQALLYKALLWGALNVSQENGWTFLLRTPQGLLPMLAVPIEPMKIFDLVKVFYDTTPTGKGEYVVIVVLYKLNYEKYMALKGK